MARAYLRLLLEEEEEDKHMGNSLCCSVLLVSLMSVYVTRWMDIISFSTEYVFAS